MVDTRRVLCHCVEVTTNDTPLFASTNSFVHIKGFAARLDPSHPIPKSLLKALSEFEVHCWDGDTLRNDSFTRYLVSAALLEPKPQLLAYRLRYHEHIEAEESDAFDTCVEPFLETWHNKIIEVKHFTTSDDHLGLDITIHDADTTDIQYDQEITIYYKQLDADLKAHRRYSNRYLELAAKALQDSESKTIICAGGGVGIEKEFQALSALNNGMSSSSSVDGASITEYQWHAWPLSRRTPDGLGREDCFFTKLRCETNDESQAIINRIKWL